jgi:hypothetical protein
MSGGWTFDDKPRKVTIKMSLPRDRESAEKLTAAARKLTRKYAAKK